LKDYLKEEIATAREVLKILFIAFFAVMGGSFSIIIKILSHQLDIYFFAIVTIGFIVSFLILVMIKFYWNRMYDFKYQLKDLNE